MLHTYFGIDPGKATGLVKIYKLDNEQRILVAAKATIKVPAMAHDWVYRLWNPEVPTTFILEKPAIRKAGARPIAEMYGVWHEKISSWLSPTDTLQIYGPGMWKPFAKANKWTRPKGWTQHETDAANLVRFHLVKVSKSMVPSGLLSTDSRVEDLVAQIQKELDNARK